MVSVIIPTYNRAAYIVEALESVFAQTYGDCEIIVVDDGSTDDTKAVLQSHMARIRYIYQENAGVSVARNTGISAATGEWIAFLDSDDQWRPTKLERQLACVQRTGLKACFTNSTIFDGERYLDRPWRKTKEPSVDEWIVDDPFAPFSSQSPPLTLPTMVVGKEILEAVGGFEDKWRIGEDTRLIFKVLQKTAAAFLDSEEAIINRTEQRAGLYGAGIASVRQRMDVQIALLADVYFSSNGLCSRVARELRYKLGYALSGRAMVACVDGDYPAARRFARESLRFSPDLRTRTRALATWASPKLVHRLCRRKTERNSPPNSPVLT